MSLPEPRHLERLPPAGLPWLYLAFAHVCLSWAVLAVVAEPSLLTGYFYQPRVIALVHAVTLGWISCTILGALYMVGPVALRCYLLASRVDAFACGAVLIGALGMISHFWIDGYSGMVWSAATLLVGVLLVSWRVLPVLVRAPVDVAVRAAVFLAFANLLLAGAWGASLGLEKTGALVLPGAVLPGVWAHAHVAGLGWATMMVMGIGYRLLPMFIPAALPRGRLPLVSVVLMQLGVLGLATSLVAGSAWAPVFGAACAASVAIFLWLMVTRMQQLRPSPRGLARPDLTFGHGVLALSNLLVAAVLGGALLVLPPGTMALRLAAAYGIFALLGFLAQLIVGVGGRLFPLVAWMQSHVRSGFVEPDFTQYELVDRRLQAVALAAWGIAVPLLAIGVAISSPGTVRAAGLLLLAALVCEGVQRVRAWSAARARFSSPDQLT